MGIDLRSHAKLAVVALGSPRLVTAAAAVAALAVAYAWFATGLYPFTWPAVAATMAAGVAVLGVGRWRGTPVRARERKPGANAGTVVWVVLALALGAWELAAFLQHPRPDHPTLSALANGVFDSHLVRAVAFLAWLGAGAGLARR
jgi:hypothetical protein